MAPNHQKKTPLGTADGHNPSGTQSSVPEDCAFFAWLEANGTVLEYDGIAKRATSRVIGRCRPVLIAGRYCLILPLTGGRWLSKLDWTPPTGDEPGCVVLFQKENSNRPKPQAAAPSDAMV